MFDWLKNWWFRRVLNRHRMLYRYWDGSKFVSEDPFVLLRKLLNSTEFNPDTDFKLLQVKSDPALVCRKIQHIAEGVRIIFNLKTCDAGGLTELECVNLVMQFIEWMETVKKNGETNQILPGSTQVQKVNQESGEAEQNSMSEPLACSSTEPES